MHVQLEGGHGFVLKKRCVNAIPTPNSLNKVSICPQELPWILLFFCRLV